MLKFFIILAAWITPGILLFLYLLWISRRRESPRGELGAPAIDPDSAPSAKTNPWELEPVQPFVAREHVETEEQPNLDAVRVSGSRR